MKEIKIKGFTSDIVPDCRPAICVFGDESSGTTRFGTTAPCDEGVIGWIAIDRNSKVVIDEIQSKTKRKLPIFVNAEPLITREESIKVALNSDTKKSMEIYTAVVERAFNLGTALAANADVQSVVVDRASQLYDMILFSHFGRKNQIESFQRGAPNQDMIDFINALSGKNLVLCCKAADIWKDSGEVDKNGKKKQAPTGKMKPDGFSKIGQFVTATIELTVARKKITAEDEDEALKQKYKAKILHCKGNTLLEGCDLTDEGIAGRDITWDNIIAALGIKS